MNVLEPTLIDHEEMDGSPQEGVDDSGPWVRRKLTCAWADRWTLIEQLLGQVRGDIYYLPHLCPYNSAIRARKISGMQAFGSRYQQAGGQTYAYEFIEIDVEYRRITSNPMEGDPSAADETFVTESVEPAAEFITLPSDGMTWATSGGAVGVDQAPGMLIRTMNWVYTIHKLSLPLRDEFLDYKGTINSGEITSSLLGRTFAAGTLLYGAPQLQREILTSGQQLASLTLRFTERKQGWNKFPNVNNLVGGVIQFEAIKNAGGDVIAPYPSSDFTKLVYQTT